MIALFLSLVSFTNAASANVNSGGHFPLFKRVPSLENQFPRVSIVTDPAPVQSLLKLEQKLYLDLGKPVPAEPKLGGVLDNRSFRGIGGNKARKLEFIIADARKKGAKTLLTSGGYGSNHALATAVVGKEFGFDVELELGPQPTSEDVRKKLLSYHALGAKLHYHPTYFSLGFGIAKLAIQDFFSKRLYDIPTGGTTPIGTLGYVNAFLELVETLGPNQMPDRIIVPVGTKGTSAGLLAGSCLAGLFGKVQIVGVNVANPLFKGGEMASRKEAMEVYRFIRDHASREDRRTFPKCDFRRDDTAFRYIQDYYAPGYGAASPEALATIQLVHETEGIQLDATYSGKAMHYLVTDSRDRIRKGLSIPKTLFWFTYSPEDLDAIIQSHPWKNTAQPWMDLPKKFWKIFQTPLDASPSDVTLNE